MGVWIHNLFRFQRKRGHKPAKKNSPSESAEELRYHKARRVKRTNSGKGVCQPSREGYRARGYRIGQPG
jgi:hypothetical protein